MLEEAKKKLAFPEAAYAAICVLVLLWINAYVCRELFFLETGHMNSMHGFWAALARLGSDSWLRTTWWPYWDCGIPFEFTYAPLVPRLTAAWAALRGIQPGLAFESISGFVYCLGPVTLFLAAWLLTCAPRYSFMAALFYSLAAPTQILAPDSNFSLTGFWDPRRLFLVSVWDETPHMTAVVLLPLIILFLARSIQRRRLGYYIAAVVTIAGAALASAFGPTMAAMAAFCLLFVLRQEDYGRNIVLTLMIGGWAYAISAPFLTPSIFGAMHTAANESTWGLGSITALALVAIGWIVLWRWLPRWTADWRLQFFALFAYLTTSIPIIAMYLHKQFLPQSGRYKVEAELALALLVVFAARPWFERRSRSMKAAVLLLILGLAGESVVSHRKFAKNILRSADLTQTIEYRAATWIDQNLHGVRVMLPGSIAQWANAFTDVRQLSGSSWSMAYNPVQQRAIAAVINGGDTPEKDARVSLAWLEAYGAGAIAVSGPQSAEFWKPFAHPTKFEGVLPVLWRADDVTIYRVPQRSASLAHVVPEAAIVQRPPPDPTNVAALERYTASLNDPALPPAELVWEGRNRMHVRTDVRPGQVISLQVSYNSGWSVEVNGARRTLNRDGLGLMWFRPGCTGVCDARLEYTGSGELRLSRYVSFLAILALVAVPVVHLRRHRVAR